jgi:hypothetical protein
VGVAPLHERKRSTKTLKISGMFERMGHPTQFEEVPGLGHIWARDQGDNDRIWSHWQAHAA